MYKKYLLIFLVLIFTTLVTFSHAGDLKITNAGYIASTSLGNMEKAMQYIFDNDDVAFEKMITSRLVFLLKEDVDVYVVEVKIFSGLIKIRPAGDTFEVWTVYEAVRYKN